MTVATFPVEKPFVDVLASRVLLHADSARLLVLLPTRRACIALREACLRRSGGAPRLLPRIQPLGDVEEEALFAETWLENELGEAARLPPAISRMHREIALTQLIMRQGGTAGIEQATLLARELARLRDAVVREELSFALLPELAPETLAHHWQVTLKALGILSAEWPAMMAREGVTEPVARRNALLRALAAQWARRPPAYEVIAAGSTGTLPATAELLKAVAALPRGAVILPGLDCESPESVWDGSQESHPQFALKRLLEHFGMTRAQVERWDDADVLASCAPERMALLRASLQPAETIHSWAALTLNVKAALHGVRYAQAETPQEEARIIALLLREVLETPQKTAAVITLDRALARRIAVELGQFGVAIDDSAGRKLLGVEQGIYLQLVADAALTQAAPVPLLSLLKHPLAACGMEPAECRSTARLLERLALRGVRPAAGFAALRQNAAGEISCTALLDALEAAMAEFAAALRQKRIPFSRLLELHLLCAERLGATPQESGAQRLWSNAEGQALAEILAELRESAPGMGAIEGQAYPALFTALLEAEVYRRPYGLHPRLHILSPMEARMQHYDMMVLAGLNEGVWPPAPEVSPWMSRPMQRAFGLPPPERAAGRSAHDFYMLAAARELVLTRSRKREGAAAQPSRFLLRLETLLHGLQGCRHDWEIIPHVEWHRVLREPLPIAPLSRPAPRPPLKARPRRLSVTEIETLQRDPYGIYARHVLRLSALEPLDREPGARELGVVTHEALRRFAHAEDQSLDALLACGAAAFAAFASRPAVRAFWWPRFAASAAWVAVQKRDFARLHAECAGRLTWQAPGGAFTLTTRLDRLETQRGGQAAIIDYKTGQPPAIKDIRAQLAQQLPLGGYVVQEGQVEGLAAGTAVTELIYWKLAGERSEAIALSEEMDIAACIGEAKARLHALIALYDDPQTPYPALPDAALAPSFNEYAHLERQAEWEANE